MSGVVGNSRRHVFSCHGSNDTSIHLSETHLEHTHSVRRFHHYSNNATKQDISTDLKKYKKNKLRENKSSEECDPGTTDKDNPRTTVTPVLDTVRNRSQTETKTIEKETSKDHTKDLEVAISLLRNRYLPRETITIVESDLTYICIIDLSNFINWASPFPILGLLCGHFYFYFVLNRNSCKLWRPWSDDASDLGPHCLSWSPKRATRLIWVKVAMWTFLLLFCFE